MNKILAVCILALAVVAVAGGVFLFRALEQTVRQSKSPATVRMFIPVSTQSGEQSRAALPKVYNQTIAIDSQPFSFVPNVFRVKMGESVTVTIKARGEHTFTIDALNVNAVTKDGQQTTVRFTPDKKGAFPFYCAQPGHKTAGQQGMLIVE